MDIEEDLVEQNLSDILKVNDAIDDLKIGLVIPMDNLRTTLRKVFKHIKGLNSNMVLSPNDVAKSKELYDLLIVDEAHRLNEKSGMFQNMGENQIKEIINAANFSIFFID